MAGLALDEVRFRRLSGAVKASYDLMEPFRAKHLEAVKQYVGTHYSDKGASAAVPINMIELGVTIFQRGLAPRAPAVLVRTASTELMPFAAKYEAVLGRVIQQIRLSRTMAAAVRDGLLGLSITKVGFNGFVYADTVDHDDVVLDMSARRFERCGFIGQKVRLPREEARRRWGKAVDDLAQRDPSWPSSNGEARLADIGGGDMTGDEPLDDMVELWEIWLRSENLIVTYQEGDDAPLSVDQWDGPNNGPYHLLAFSFVPGNLMPLPPVSSWMDNHMLINSVRRKLGRQAKRFKQLLLAPGGSKADVDNILEAEDGDAVRCENGRSMEERGFGGPNQQLFALMLQMREIFKEQAGNLDALGGLAPQADTLGQDKMLQSSASFRMQDMQAQVLEFLQGVVAALGHFIWRKDMGLRAEVPFGFDLDFLGSGMPFEFGGPDRRDGEEDDFALSIQPYSLEPQTPQRIKAEVDDLWRNAILPLAPLLAEQGIVPNMEGYLRLRARLSHLDEIEQLVTFTQSGRKTDKSAPHDAVLKPPSKGEYLHRSVSGGSPQGKTQAMISTMMGANVQRKEKG